MYAKYVKFNSEENKLKKLCMCCMEEHETSVVEVQEKNIFKGKEVEYTAIYEYCGVSEEYIMDEKMISANDIAMKNAYRKAMGLLTSDEIIEIREKYLITQKDLAIILGWGEKTITRYERHQVQDMAHDAVLRKISDDPEWFMELIEKGKGRIPEETYEKYIRRAKEEYESKEDSYLRKTILAQYIKFMDFANYYGNTKIDFDKIVECIRYFACAEGVLNLYKVKLMKLLWYADFLSFKRYGNSITGMVYRAQKMGALPVAHKSIVELKGIEYEEVVFENGVGVKFLEAYDIPYEYLTEKDIEVLNTVVDCLGTLPTGEIIKKMHKEIAYEETELNDIIDYKYAYELSIS